MILSRLLLLLLTFVCLALSSDMFSLFLDDPVLDQQQGGGSPLGTCVSRLSRQRALTARCRRQCSVKLPCLVAPSVDGPLYSAELVYMQRQVRRLLQVLRAESGAALSNWLFLGEGETPGAFTLHVRLSGDQLEKLREFVEGGQVHVADVDELLGAALDAARVEDPSCQARDWLWLQQLLVPSVPLTGAVVVGALVLLWARLGCGWRSLVGFCVLTCLVAGCVTNWHRLYQQRVTERHVTLSQQSGEHICRPGGWLSWLWGGEGVSGECLRYYQLLESDPRLAVGLGEVLALTLSELLLSPAEQLGHAVGRYHAALALHLSWWQLLPVTLAAAAFMLATVSMLLGYELRLLMGLLAVGPSRGARFRSPEPPAEAPRSVCCSRGAGDTAGNNMVLTINSARDHALNPPAQNLTIVLQQGDKSPALRSSPRQAAGDGSRSQLERLMSHPDCHGNSPGARARRLDRSCVRHRASSLDSCRQSMRGEFRDPSAVAEPCEQEEDESLFLQQLHRVMNRP